MGKQGTARGTREVDANMRALRAVALSWTADAAVLAVLARIASIGMGLPLLYLAIGLAYVGVVSIMLRRGYTERFADPTLSFPQLVLATANQCLCLWLAPAIGIFFLLNIFQVFAYGLFTLTAGQFRMLLMLAALMVLPAFLASGHLISFPVDTGAARLLLFVVFVTCLARFVWVGNYAGALRRGLKAKSMALTESEARFRALTELSSDWFWEQDAQLRFSRVETDGRHAAPPEAALIGKLPWETGFEVELEGGWDSYRQLVAQQQEFRDIVMKRRTADGEEYIVSVSGRALLDATGALQGYRGVAREITEKRLAQQRIEHLATHDILTGLPNRLMFTQLLDMAARMSRRSGRKFALLFIDLDRFKLVNDTLGHEAGDALLKEIAHRFTETLRSSDIVARLGGDEFVVLVQELEGEAQATTVAEKLLAAAALPVVVAGQECRVSASIGIAVFPDDADDAGALLRNADSAMYLAKEEGKNVYRFYSHGVHSHAFERMTVENELRHALVRDEFVLQYQVRRALANGEISGVEALLRWHNPRLGTVAPVQFLRIAEESGAIIPIGKWVLRAACEQAIAWQRMGLPPVAMAVNLSPTQFAHPRLLQDIGDALAASGLAPERLELEITEAMLFHEPQRAAATLRALKGLGVKLAVEDFGSGYTTLGQMRELPVDTLKVDRSFIRNLDGQPESRALTEAIINFGRELRATVVAEGVETAEQERFLRLSACDAVQGFYVSKPLPPDDLPALFAAPAGVA
ncbi:MAG TPA: EAL domain-containing protein [Noviherbaspirillum sp.]|jgi:diguanylate cyclase (GGDEF)-like protein/PAS domain S-box-containing protein|uniref:putative bifunctional diguanylate cyclase/phosphodiesterase n=1 Tax=Noviherbaspirillum sp. TaxID=1926288 RepID=UPI002F92D701